MYAIPRSHSRFFAVFRAKRHRLTAPFFLPQKSSGVLCNMAVGYGQENRESLITLLRLFSVTTFRSTLMHFFPSFTKDVSHEYLSLLLYFATICFGIPSSARNLLTSRTSFWTLVIFFNRWIKYSTVIRVLSYANDIAYGIHVWDTISSDHSIRVVCKSLDYSSFNFRRLSIRWMIITWQLNRVMY